MTRAKLIKSLGEVLVRLDRLRKNQAIDEKTRLAATEVRNVLAKQQMLLAIGDFADSVGFCEAADAVDAISAELCRSMDLSETSIVPFSNLVRAIDVLLRGEYSFRPL